MKTFNIRFWPQNSIALPRVYIEVWLDAPDMEEAIVRAKEIAKSCQILPAESGGAWHGRTVSKAAT